MIVREQTSFERVLKYTQKVLLHRDFAYDILANSQQLIAPSQKPYIIINCNSHLWNKQVKKKVEDFCRKHSDCVPYYFPAAMGDDSDVPYYEILKQKVPNIELYDWRDKSIEDTLSFFSHATA